jgi:hypothetical protein
MKAILLASAVLAVSLSATSITAQRLKEEDIPKIDKLVPLRDYLQRPAEKQVESYPFIRCAGIYLGYKYYAGKNFDTETRKSIEDAIDTHQNAAIILSLLKTAQRRGKSTGSLGASAQEEIMRDLISQSISIGTFYEERMKSNFIPHSPSKSMISLS